MSAGERACVDNQKSVTSAALSLGPFIKKDEDNGCPWVSPTPLLVFLENERLWRVHGASLRFPQSVRAGDLTLKHLLKKTTTHSGHRTQLPSPGDPPASFFV